LLTIKVYLLLKLPLMSPLDWV